MRIERVVLRHCRMDLRTPFVTSGWSEEQIHFILVEAHAGGLVGYGEAPLGGGPWYNEETVGTGWHVLSEYLIPRVVGRSFADASELEQVWHGERWAVRRHFIAKAGLELAVWDLLAKVRGIPLARALGGGKDRVPVGISVGIRESIADELRVIEGYLRQGYRRVKVKIRPGFDVELVRAIRGAFGDIPLMADANSAYRLEDLPALRELDAFGLMMIEQPLGHDDIIDHATLQRALRTPICLDESIHTPEDARKAIEIGACRIINIKVSRVGGLHRARQLHDLCHAAGVPVWCGGMLESGVGRAHNVAIATLPDFTLPGDTAASSRYWDEDIIEPPVTISADGHIAVPEAPGIGYEVVPERVERRTLRKEVFEAR